MTHETNVALETLLENLVSEMNKTGLFNVMGHQAHDTNLLT